MPGVKYCRVCGTYAHPENPDAHDQAGMEAIRRNPMLALLFTPTDELDLNAPIILGGVNQPTIRLDE